MSATQCFALCIDCWEMHYGITDSNGVYTRDSASSNHWDHAVHVFGKPEDYPAPFRQVLTHLHAGLPVSDGAMEMFSLACALEAIQPNNGIAVSPATPAAPRLTRMQRLADPAEAVKVAERAVARAERDLEFFRAELEKRRQEAAA